MRKVLLLAAIAVMFMALMPFTNAIAQIPRLINYQASLLDQANQPVTGTLSVTFAIYEDISGGSPLWTETQTIASTQGFINATLGQTIPLNLQFDKPYYLEVKVGNGTPYPRTSFTANPYAMHSLYATKSDTATIALTVVDGAITQTKLDPSVQALPWGPAGGGLKGSFPNPVLNTDSVVKAVGTLFIKKTDSPLGDLDGTWEVPTIRLAKVLPNRISPIDPATGQIVAPGKSLMVKAGDNKVTWNPTFAFPYDYSGANAVGGAWGSALNIVPTSGLAISASSSSFNGLGLQPALTVNNNLVNGVAISVPQGRVGIGTVTPNNLIQVSGLINFDNVNQNTFLGQQAGSFNTGSNNLAVGNFALQSGNSGTFNTAIGIGAQDFNLTGNMNTAVGYNALIANQSGNNNVAIGNQAGGNATGSGNVFIGNNAGQNEFGSNKLYIANSNVNPPLIYGDFATGNVGLGTIAPTSKLQVVGLPVYVNNAAAIAGGLTAGAFYRTGADPDVVCVVH